ncbi:hypothetical protein BGZ60DRAFT_428622 [Tricladium varicosporioides]|nr:hypothetical protein BGZ60DRAFT_428622 [Hymenoscyphus varicosporioides]
MGISRLLLRLIQGGPAIPPHAVTNDGWITTNSTTFAAQWIDCQYSISGSYERGPRYLYYFLAFLALAGRKHKWIVDVALISVMTISTLASVHAIGLVALRSRMVPRSLLENYTSITISGNNATDILLPIIPMVWNGDSDAVLSIVGISFLLTTPMQMGSKTFRKSNRKLVMIIWSVLLLVGMNAALINEWYISTRTFRQLRVCPIGRNDTLPFRNGGHNYNGEYWGSDYNLHINDTIRTEFIEKAGTLPSICIYFCFDTVSPFRNADEILAVDLEGWIMLTTDVYWNSMYAVYIFISTAGISTFTLVLLKSRKGAWSHRPRSFNDLRIKWKTAISKAKEHESTSTEETPTKLKLVGLALWSTWLSITIIYTRFLSVLVLVGFAVWIEYTIWWDHQGENFQLLDQWAPVLATLLISLCAAINYAQLKWEARRQFLKRSGEFTDKEAQAGGESE